MEVNWKVMNDDMRFDREAVRACKYLHYVEWFADFLVREN